MTAWINFSESKILKIQSEIDKYRTDFFKRSSGINLPKTICLGGLEKPNRSKSEIDFFVSMPVKNQESIISSVLHDLVLNMGKNFKLGLLFDNCDDDSFNKSRNFLMTLSEENRHLQEVYFLESEGELFESSAENILFKLCAEQFFVSIQADTYFTDPTFMVRSELAFSVVPNLFAVSGKAIVSFEVLTKFKAICNSLLHFFNFIRKLLFRKNKKVRLGIYLPNLGYFGDLSSPPYVTMKFTNRELNSLYLGESLIRGPVIWKAETFRKLNGFNDVAHPLGRDECDICFRACLSGYVSGYLPCKAFSIFKEGTTRKKRSKFDQRILDERNLLAKRHPSRLLNFWNGKLESDSLELLKQQKNKFKHIYGNSVFLTKRS